MMVLSNFKSTQREFQRELVEITRHKKYILFIKIWHYPFIAGLHIFERGQSLISQNLLQCILYTGFFFVLSLQHKWIARISFIFHSLVVFFLNFTFWAHNGQTDVFFYSSVLTSFIHYVVEIWKMNLCCETIFLPQFFTVSPFSGRLKWKMITSIAALFKLIPFIETFESLYFVFLKVGEHTTYKIKPAPE